MRDIPHTLILILLCGLLLSIMGCTSHQQLEGAPDEPAGDDFRSDDPTRVANTGKPQLIELWADW